MSEQPYNFLRDYLAYNGSNEAPRNFHIFSALVVIAAAMTKRIYVNSGFYRTYPNLYVGLIGSMGSRKSTAKDLAKDLFYDVFTGNNSIAGSDYPTIASVQSREDVIRYMNEDGNEFMHKCADTEELISIRPIVGFVNELKNFLSVDPGKMVEFLTDIYNTNEFKSGTIKRGDEHLKNPCMNLLVCETPEWVIDKLKSGLMSGGWARRIIYVYEIERAVPIPFPERPPGSDAIHTRMKEHLRKLWSMSGEFKWTAEAKAWYEPWYCQMRNNPPEDKMMAGYYESKHDQLFKIMMCLACCEAEPKFIITKDGLVQALAILDIVEKTMPKLFSAVGRNELAIPMQSVLEMINRNKGAIPERHLRIAMEKDLNTMEYNQILNHLRDTDQVVILDQTSQQEVKKKFVLTRAEYDRRQSIAKAKAEEEAAKATAAATQPST